MDLGAVERAMRAVADREIRPRFRALADHQVSLKGHHDYVTEADIEAERALTPLLREVIDAPVIGEEATASDPALADAASSAPAAWTLDPVDGTYNFVRGADNYAVLVSYLEHGEPQAAWILHPETGDIFTAVHGKGAALNGEPLVAPAPLGPAKALTGAFAREYIVGNLRAHLTAREPYFAELRSSNHCAGWDYTDVIRGRVDFTVFWGSSPWDHAPGSLIAREAGCRVARPLGHDYYPGVTGAGILVAHEDVWPLVARSLFA